MRDAIDLRFNQHISVLRLRHAHHPGVQDELARVNCLGGPWSSDYSVKVWTCSDDLACRRNILEKQYVP
jgi:hypothetical protein